MKKISLLCTTSIIILIILNILEKIDQNWIIIPLFILIPISYLQPQEDPNIKRLGFYSAISLILSFFLIITKSGLFYEIRLPFIFGIILNEFQRIPFFNNIKVKYCILLGIGLGSAYCAYYHIYYEITLFICTSCIFEAAFVASEN